MESARWLEIEAHFHRLVDRPLAEQTFELSAISAADVELANDVRAMLDADASGRSILDRTPASLAQSLLHIDRALPAMPFGPYRLTALLGEGGMGVVYLGTRADLNAQAAIKVLRDAWLSPSRRERFLVEQRTLVSLEHPGIARLLDADRLPDGTPWFAMEYVEGTPITAFALTRNASLAERLALFRQACAAVRYAHERGVLHRDIKPSNIIVSRDGVVKLLDFGIAKSLGGPARSIESTAPDLRDATQTQHRLLTPAYASPEQLRGESVGVQTDVFSLGVLLFELLSAARPYDTEGLSTGEAAAHIEALGAARVTTTLRIPRDGAVSVERLGGSARDDLDALVACALHPDRQRRYRSVDALMVDLAHFERQEPLSVRADSTTYRLRKFMARRWREAATVLVVLGLGTSGIVSYTIGLDRARRAAEEETARVRALRDFLVSLFDGGDEDAGPSPQLRVADIVDNGVRASRARVNDPKLQAELFSVLGHASRGLGRPEQADSLLRTALTLKQQQYGESSVEAIEAMVNLANHEITIGRAAEGISALERAYRLATALLPPSEPVRALATEQFGMALAQADSTRLAIVRLEEAVSLRARVDTADLTYADALSALADAYYYDNQFAKSESLNLLVIDKTARVLGRDHPSVAFNLLNMGRLAGLDGRSSDAERYAREALAICERYFGPDHTRTAAALKDVGLALTNQGKDKEALPLIRRALSIQERTLGPSAGPVATALNALASAELRAGDPERGLALFERAIGIYVTMYGPLHQNTLTSRANMASALLRLERVDSAARTLSDVVRIGARSLSPDHQGLATWRIRLGRARLAQKRYAEAVEASMAGLIALEKTSSAPTSYSRGARKDLRTAYLALGDAARAAAFADPDARLDAALLPSKGAATKVP